MLIPESLLKVLLSKKSESVTIKSLLIQVTKFFKTTNYIKSKINYWLFSTRKYQNYNRMAKEEFRWLVPGLMQIPVCLALIVGVGFNFDDLKSTVMFLYAYHHIMMAFKASFRVFFHQDCDEVVYLPIVMFNAVTQVILQCWGFSIVSTFIWQNNDNSCEKTPTVISAIIIVGIELVLVVIMLVNIYNSQLGARMSKCLLGKRPQSEEMVMDLENSQSEECTNSRTPVNNDELNEDMVVGLLTTNNHNNSNTENDMVDS